MFEFEIESEVVEAEGIDLVRKQFDDSESMITSRTILEWGEHCTECAVPTCYFACDFYTPRSDGKCRRFLGGISRIEEMRSMHDSLARMTFKKWGKRWALGHTHFLPIKRANAAFLTL